MIKCDKHEIIMIFTLFQSFFLPGNLKLDAMFLMLKMLSVSFSEIGKLKRFTANHYYTESNYNRQPHIQVSRKNKIQVMVHSF